MMLLRVTPESIVPFVAGVEIRFPLTMKILLEETSSIYLLFTESRYNTSENPLLFALFSAFKTWLT